MRGCSQQSGNFQLASLTVKPKVVRYTTHNKSEVSSKVDDNRLGSNNNNKNRAKLAASRRIDRARERVERRVSSVESSSAVTREWQQHEKQLNNKKVAQNFIKPNSPSHTHTYTRSNTHRIHTQTSLYACTLAFAVICELHKQLVAFVPLGVGESSSGPTVGRNKLLT